MGLGIPFRLLLLSCLMLTTAVCLGGGHPMPMTLPSVFPFADDSHLGFVWGGHPIPMTLTSVLPYADDSHLGFVWGQAFSSMSRQACSGTSWLCSKDPGSSQNSKIASEDPSEVTNGAIRQRSCKSQQAISTENLTDQHKIQCTRTHRNMSQEVKT